MAHVPVPEARIPERELYLSRSRSPFQHEAAAQIDSRAAEFNKGPDPDDQPIEIVCDAEEAAVAHRQRIREADLAAFEGE